MFKYLSDKRYLQIEMNIFQMYNLCTYYTNITITVYSDTTRCVKK